MQNNWSFSFGPGDPHTALLETQKIVGIHGRELVSLQEIIHVFSELTPPATVVEVEAAETVNTVAKECSVTQTVSYNSRASRNIAWSDHDAPAAVKAAVGEQQYIEQQLRWSARNACDEVMLTTAKWMTIVISQQVTGNKTVATITYTFEYDPA